MHRPFSRSILAMLACIAGSTACGSSPPSPMPGPSAPRAASPDALPAAPPVAVLGARAPPAAPVVGVPPVVVAPLVVVVGVAPPPPSDPRPGGGGGGAMLGMSSWPSAAGELEAARSRSWPSAMSRPVMDSTRARQASKLCRADCTTTAPSGDRHMRARTNQASLRRAGKRKRARREVGPVAGVVVLVVVLEEEEVLFAAKEEEGGAWLELELAEELVEEWVCWDAVGEGWDCRDWAGERAVVGVEVAWKLGVWSVLTKMVPPSLLLLLLLWLLLLLLCSCLCLLLVGDDGGHSSGRTAETGVECRMRHTVATARATSIFVGSASLRSNSAVSTCRLLRSWAGESGSGLSGAHSLLALGGQPTSSRRASDTAANCVCGWASPHVDQSRGSMLASSRRPRAGLLAAGMARFLRQPRTAWVSCALGVGAAAATADSPAAVAAVAVHRASRLVSGRWTAASRTSVTQVASLRARLPRARHAAVCRFAWAGGPCSQLCSVWKTGCCSRPLPPWAEPGTKSGSAEMSASTGTKASRTCFNCAASSGSVACAGSKCVYAMEKAVGQGHGRQAAEVLEVDGVLPVRGDAEEDQGRRWWPVADLRLLCYQELEDLADEVDVETACFEARAAEDLHQPLAEAGLAGLKLNGLCRRLVSIEGLLLRQGKR
ncbi:hypothetical protein VSDG_01560 [Cytospora chrysosperma]|uniref:Uncharacterized protein n=1 Tax=Cytospora chrysosperma TaxID=252740 RepID=A0A423WIM3_CYTCH|nr:hypothetical protein VSDG_01560 [Valsa sordida]